VPRGFSGEVSSDLKHRQEGVRIKHRLNQNSIKFYDKADVGDRIVGRVEMTLNQEGDFRVYRPREEDPKDALASLDDSATVAELAARIQKRVIWNGRPFRALHPFEPEDSALRQAVNRGEFTVNGFRNRDLRGLLFAHPPRSARQARQRSAALSRKLRLLRAHGLIRQVPHTHRYHVTAVGRKLILAVLTARQVTLQALNAILAPAA